MQAFFSYSSTSLNDSVDLMDTLNHFITQHSFHLTPGKETILDFILTIPSTSHIELMSKISYINQIIDAAKVAGPPNYMGQPLVLWTKFGSESEFNIWTVLAGVTAPIDLGTGQGKVYQLHVRLKIIKHPIGQEYSLSNLVIKPNQTLFVPNIRGVYSSFARLNLGGKLHVGVRGHSLLQQGDFDPKYPINSGLVSNDGWEKIATVYGHGAKFDNGMAELFLDLVDGTPYIPNLVNLTYKINPGSLKGSFLEYGQTGLDFLGNESGLSNLVDVELPGSIALTIPKPSKVSLGGNCINPGTFSIDLPSSDLSSDGWVLSELITQPLLVKGNPLYGNVNPTNKLPPKPGELGYCYSYDKYPFPDSLTKTRSVAVTLNISQLVLGNLASPAFFPLLGTAGIMFDGFGWKLYYSSTEIPVSDWKSSTLTTSSFSGIVLNSNNNIAIEMSWIFDGFVKVDLKLGGNIVATVFVSGSPNNQQVLLGCILTNELPEYTLTRVLDLNKSNWSYTKIQTNNTSTSTSTSFSNSKNTSSTDSSNKSSSSSSGLSSDVSSGEGSNNNEGYSLGSGSGTNSSATSSFGSNANDNAGNSASKSYTILKNIPTITTSKQTFDFIPVQGSTQINFEFHASNFNVDVSYKDVIETPPDKSVTRNSGDTRGVNGSTSGSGSATSNFSDSVNVGDGSDKSESSGGSFNKGSSSSQADSIGTNTSDSNSTNKNKSTTISELDNRFDIPVNSYTRQVDFVATISTITGSSNLSSTQSSSNTLSDSFSQSSSQSTSQNFSDSNSSSHSSSNSTSSNASIGRARGQNETAGEGENRSSSSSESQPQDYEFGKVTVDTGGTSSVDVQSSFGSAQSSNFSQTRITNPPTTYWLGGPNITGSHTEHTIESSWEFDPYHNPLSAKFDKAGIPQTAMVQSIPKGVWPGQNNNPRYSVLEPEFLGGQLATNRTLIDAGTVTGFPESSIEHSESDNDNHSSGENKTNGSGTNSSTSLASNNASSRSSSGNDSRSSSTSSSSSFSSSESIAHTKDDGGSTSSSISTSDSVSIQDVYKITPLIETILPNMVANVARAKFSFSNLQVFDGPVDGFGSSVLLNWTPQANLANQKIYRRKDLSWQYYEVGPTISSLVDDGSLVWTKGNPPTINMSPGMFRATINGILDTDMVRAKTGHQYLNLGPVMLAPTPNLNTNSTWFIDLYGSGKNMQINSLYLMPHTSSRIESDGIPQTNRYLASSDVGTMQLEVGQNVVVILAEDEFGVPLDLTGTIVSLDITEQNEYL